jgi:hypothetical protein
MNTIDAPVEIRRNRAGPIYYVGIGAIPSFSSVFAVATVG